MYRAQYIVTIDYDESPSKESQRIAHYDFLAFTRYHIERVKSRINQANYRFKIRNITIDKGKED